MALPTGRVENGKDQTEPRQGRDGDGNVEWRRRREQEPTDAAARNGVAVGTGEEHKGGWWSNYQECPSTVRVEGLLGSELV